MSTPTGDEQARRENPGTSLTRAGAAMRRAVGRLEDSTSLDRGAVTLRAAASAVLGDPRRAALLRGVPLGHAAHPVLTDLPIGLWMSASALDLLGPVSGRRAADGLVGWGLLATVPTALAGIADWGQTEASDVAVRRVGVVHVAANTIATSLYATSWLLRRRGCRAAGVLTALAGGAALGVSGYLGGHMAVVRGAPHETRESSLANRGRPS